MNKQQSEWVNDFIREHHQKLTDEQMVNRLREDGYGLTKIAVARRRQRMELPGLVPEATQEEQIDIRQDGNVIINRNTKTSEASACRRVASSST